ncbi:unnamed protein product, partial [Musa acuminata subsp. burmannicoides]
QPSQHPGTPRVAQGWMGPSLVVRRSPLPRAAKNGQFWPVFGSFWPVFGLFLRGAATVVSGVKCQPSQH